MKARPACFCNEFCHSWEQSSITSSTTELLFLKVVRPRTEQPGIRVEKLAGKRGENAVKEKWNERKSIVWRERATRYETMVMDGKKKSRFEIQL